MYQIIASRNGVSFKHYPKLYESESQAKGPYNTIRRNFANDKSVFVRIVKVG
jgi:hypothetical protein